jgi:hypothetical protein
MAVACAAASIDGASPTPVLRGLPAAQQRSHAALQQELRVRGGLFVQRREQGVVRRQTEALAQARQG